MKELLIAGGGFAGVWAAMAAAATRQQEDAGNLSIRVVSKSDQLSVRPRFYEGATSDMLVPIRPLLDEIGVDLIIGDIRDVCHSNVTLGPGDTLKHDRLILATGSYTSRPPVTGAEDFGFVVDTHDSTQRLDAHLGTLDPSSHCAGTILIIGASFTGLEVALALRSRLSPDFRIVLIDRNSTAGVGLGDALEAEIHIALRESNIEFRGETSVDDVSDRHVRLSSGEIIETCTPIFATGFRASPLTQPLGSHCAQDGRLLVDKDLRVSGVPTVFAAGDVAQAIADEGRYTLMSCQHAMPMGLAAGKNAVLDLIGKATTPYSQPFYATCLDLGPYGGVFTNGWDREIVKTRAEGAAMKTQINTQWIYPPSPDLGRNKIFEAVMDG